MSTFNIIAEDDLKTWLGENPSWSLAGDEIKAGYKFKNFTEAFGFMARVATVLEKHNHHPTIENAYNKVSIAMNTHDAGNKITNKDLELAEEIESLK